MFKKLTISLLALVVILVSCSDNTTENPVIKEIKIGALLSKTGGGKSLGESAEAALQIALEDINDVLEMQNAKFRISLVIEDTQTNPDVALQKLQEFHAQGIRFVVGPQVSAEAEKILSYANENKMVLLSPTSVAISLAIPNDNLYRLTPSDHSQGLAMATYMVSMNKKHIVGVIRDDVWGNDLQTSVSQSLSENAGFSFNKTLKYKTNETLYFNLLTELMNETEKARILDDSYATVGIYLASFAEGAEIIKNIEVFQGLTEPVWFGASAFANNKTVETDTAVGRIAHRIGLVCPIYGFNDDAKTNWEPLMADIESLIGRTPDIYAVCAYDALILAGLTYKYLSSQSEFEESNSEKLIPGLKTTANSYVGANGKIEFDNAGDRANADYDFWGVKEETQGKYVWKKTAKFITKTKQIITY